MIQEADALHGATLACENAERLFVSSAHLKREGFVGPAVALCVLAFEEAAKSISLVYRSQGVRDGNWLRDYFRNHKAKHELGTNTLLFSASQLAKIDFQIDFNGSIFVAANLHSRIEEWRQNADEMKKRGFYVDFDSGNWLTPTEITEDVYELGAIAAGIAIGAAKVFIASAS